MRHLLWRVGLVVASLLLLVGCDVEREIEKLLGAVAQAFWEVGFERSDDPLLTELTQTAGQRIAEVSPRKDMPIRFRVLDVGDVNAFALPNGRIYVFRGLLETADTEDEVAAVLAHEVGHVAGRHSLKQFRLSLGIGLLADLLNLNKQGATVQALAGVASTLYQLGYSRQHERDADTYAFRLALLASYDPQGSVALFEKFAQREGRPSRLLSYLSTHPPSTERLERAKRVTADLGRIYPDLPAFAARTLIAAGYAQRGLYRQAARYYQAAAQEQPRHVPALLGLAQAKEALGERAEAKEWYERVLEIEPNNPEAQQGLLRLQQQSDPSPSISPTPAPEQTLTISLAWFAQAIAEFTQVQQRWQKGWQTTVTATNAAVTQSQTLWSQLRLVSAQFGGSIKLGSLSFTYTPSRDRRQQSDRQGDKALSWHELRRLEEVRRRQEELADDCARLLGQFHFAIAELESLLEDGRRATALWHRSLSEWQELTRKGCLFPAAFARAADESARILFRLAVSLEHDSESVRDLEQQLSRAIAMLVDSVNLSQRPQGMTAWSAESRLQWAQTALQRARAELQTLMAQVKEKRRQVDKALLSAYQTRLAALEAKTPLPVALKIVAYHLRLSEEQVRAVREKAPDIGATALLLAFAKARQKSPEQLLTATNFQGDWISELIANRAPSGVRVALRWLTTAWEREWDAEETGQRNGETEKRGDGESLKPSPVPRPAPQSEEGSHADAGQ